tara:strand:- start:74 stop:1033 length:960 start_codon:yes stop_codon:yes gene_type:complete
MTTNIKTKKLTVKQIADKIKAGQWAKKTSANVTDFFIDIGNGNYHDGDYIIDRETRFQVREKDVDRDRIKRAINKIWATGDASGLNKITFIYYEKLGILKIINGNHTIEIMLGSNILKAEDCNVVSFENDLDGKESNLRRLGNLLNEQTVETVPASNEDVRNELWVIMDENKEEGNELEPTSEQKQEFLDAYPFIDEYQFAQFVARHPDTKAYTKCDKTYTKNELKVIRESYRQQLKYQDYAVLSPAIIDTWFQVPIAEMFRQTRDEGKKKALAIFYCDTIIQRDKLIKGDIIKKMNIEYSTLSEHWGITIKYEFLAYQ